MSDPGFRLSWLPVGHILQALAHDFAADLAAPLAEIAESRPFAIRRAGPDGWFLIGEAELSPADFHAKAERIAPVAGLIDQSHGRRRLLIEGPRAERRLAHGIGLDLARLRLQRPLVEREPVGGIEPEPMSARLRLEHQRERAVAIDVNAFERVHLDRDIQGGCHGQC